MNAPSARADVHGHGNIVVQASGSGNVTINAVTDDHIPRLYLTQFEARTKLADDGSDAALLSAYRTDVIPLLGRKHALDSLRRWLTSGRPVSIRVMTGGAGRGKTRLALELVREAARDGWVAGFVEQRELDRFRAQQNAAAFLPDLAESLNNLGMCSFTLGRREECWRPARGPSPSTGDLPKPARTHSFLSWR